MQYLLEWFLKVSVASSFEEIDRLHEKAQEKLSASSLVSVGDVGIAVVFLAKEVSKLIAGGTHYIDGGSRIIDRQESVRRQHRKC